MLKKNNDSPVLRRMDGVSWVCSAADGPYAADSAEQHLLFPG